MRYTLIIHLIISLEPNQTTTCAAEQDIGVLYSFETQAVEMMVKPVHAARQGKALHGAFQRRIAGRRCPNPTSWKGSLES